MFSRPSVDDQVGGKGERGPDKDRDGLSGQSQRDGVGDAPLRSRNRGTLPSSPGA